MTEQQNPIRAQPLAKLNSPDCPSSSEEEQKVWNLRWGLEAGAVLPIDHVASILGKSREYVRQTEQQALTKLRT